MTRARILADYVSTGVTAAELDQLDTTSGTAGSGNFLRGDKTWVAAGGTLIRTAFAVNPSKQLRTDAGTEDCGTVSITVDSTSDWILATGIFRYQLYGAGASDSIYGYLDIYDTTASAVLTHNTVTIDNTTTSDAATYVNKVSQAVYQTYFHPSATAVSAGTQAVKLRMTWSGTAGGRMQVFGEDDAETAGGTSILLQYIKG